MLNFAFSFQDVPMQEESVAEINTKIRHSPSLLELKPHAELVHGPYHHKQYPHKSHHETHKPQHHYQPHKFRPIAEIKDFRPSYHLSTQMSEESYGSGEVSGSGSYSPAPTTHKPKTIIKVKKPELKKVKLVTPGLKHFATVANAFFSRRDYSNYFHQRAHDEQRLASHKMVQSMYRRNPRSSLMPQYAPELLNYDSL